MLPTAVLFPGECIAERTRIAQSAVVCAPPAGWVCVLHDAAD